MKKIILTCCISLCFIFVLSLSACKKEVEENKNEYEGVMPPIVFYFSEHNSCKEHIDDTWFIDNQGIVYHIYGSNSVPDLLEVCIGK